MKILFLTHGFPPTQHSGVFRPASFAKYLPEFGISPVVLCSVPGSHSRVLEYGDSQTNGAGRHPEPVRCDWGLDWDMDGLPRPVRMQLRLPGLNSLTRWRLVRTRLRSVCEIASDTIRQHAPSVILSTSPPVEALLIGEELSQQSGLPHVCDLRDPWTYAPWARYRSRFDFMLERGRERRLLKRAATVIANSETSRRLLVEKVGLAADCVVVITNGYDEDDFSAIDESDLYPGRFVVAYSGLMSTPNATELGWKNVAKRIMGFDYRPWETDLTTRSPHYILSAAEELLDARADLRERLLLLFVGNYNASDQRAFRAFRYRSCLEVRPPVSSIEATRICCGAQMLLLLQLSMRHNGVELCPCIPGKLYNYLRTGTPILAAVESREIIDLLKSIGSSRFAGPRDIHAIRIILEEEIDAWKVGRRRLTSAAEAIRAYDRRALTGRLASILWEAGGGEVPPVAVGADGGRLRNSAVGALDPDSFVGSCIDRG